MKKPSLKSALVAFFGSRNAVGEGSLKAWGAQQRPPVGASTAEALADELVAEGVASVEERSGGRRVWRLVREEPAPAPEPEEEPVAVAGAEEPCQGCAELTSQLATRTEERDDAIWRYTARTAERDEALRERDDLRRRLETPPAALDQGAIAHYLLSLPEERWASLATARKQLARAREIAFEAQRLEEAALAAVDGLLSAPAAAPEPVPATELVPDPIPLGPTPPPAPQAKRGPRTKDGEPAPGTARAKILAWFRRRPDATATVKEVAAAFDRPVPDMSSVLTTMRNAGYLRRTGPGIYQAVKP